jgi:hypothetical protein
MGPHEPRRARLQPARQAHSQRTLNRSLHWPLPGGVSERPIVPKPADAQEKLELRTKRLHTLAYLPHSFNVYAPNSIGPNQKGFRV